MVETLMKARVRAIEANLFIFSGLFGWSQVVGIFRSSTVLLLSSVFNVLCKTAESFNECQENISQTQKTFKEIKK
jgi:hypothetical protein